MMLRLKAMIFSAALVLMAFSQPALAQSFSDSEIALFVEAQAEVMEIRDEYVALLEQAEDRDEAMALEQEASQLMVSAVEDTGISVAEYSAIAEAAAEDLDLANRIRELMD